jgi:hypothetical protein
MVAKQSLLLTLDTVGCGIKLFGFLFVIFYITIHANAENVIAKYAILH